MNFISTKVLMDRITRHPLMEDIPYETVVDYAIDFIRIVGTPPSFFGKTALVTIEDFRGKLPCDFYDMIQVRTDKGEYFRYSTDTFHMSPYDPKKNSSVMVVIQDKSDGVPLEKPIILSDRSSRTNFGLTYKIQGDCIFTSIKDGEIEIAYQALPMDDEGYPLLPDNSSYIRALESYIKMQWFTIQFDLGKITPQVMQNAQQQYAFNVAQAQSNLLIPNIDQMEAISNMWNKLLPDTTNDHQNGYIHEGTREHINIH